MHIPHSSGSTVTPVGNTSLARLIRDAKNETISFHDFVVQAKALGYRVSNVWNAQHEQPYIYPVQ